MESNLLKLAELKVDEAKSGKVKERQYLMLCRDDGKILFSIHLSQRIVIERLETD